LSLLTFIVSSVDKVLVRREVGRAMPPETVDFMSDSSDCCSGTGFELID